MDKREVNVLEQQGVVHDYGMNSPNNWRVSSRGHTFFVVMATLFYALAGTCDVWTPPTHLSTAVVNKPTGSIHNE
jgi:hypothetical protein